MASDASQCDLCGSEVTQPEQKPAGNGSGRGVHCNECGWKNPAGSRFCSQCGSALQAVEPAERPEQPMLPPEIPQPEAPAKDEGIGKQVTLLIGGAVMVVVALYLVTIISKQNVTTGGVQTVLPPSPTAVLEDLATEPLAEEIQRQVDEIRRRIDGTTGEARRENQRSLVDLLYESMRPDLAGVEAQFMAEESGEVGDWRDAGDLYFQWMETAEPQLRADIAQLTMAAYEHVLALTPDNHDVRANLAWAAQYDAGNPMRAIDETNHVLERAPDHVQANFNRGYFLMRINRFDEAVEQLERVQELAGEESPVGRQAAMLVQIVREEQERLGTNR